MCMAVTAAAVVLNLFGCKLNSLVLDIVQCVWLLLQLLFSLTCLAVHYSVVLDTA